MTNIAIVEDNDAEAQALADGIKRFMDGAKEKYALRRFDNAEAFLENYSSRYDLVFMDIRLPMMDGMQAAERLRKMDGDAALVFVTDMAQLASKGYKVDALDFIVKPIDEYGFALKMDRALSRLSASANDNLLLRVDGEFVSIRLGTLQYVETDGHYLVYHTPDGDYREYASLKSAAKRLGGNFVRCNSCYLVNLRFVTGVSRNKVLIAGAELPISRPKKKSFMEALTAFMGGVGETGDGKSGSYPGHGGLWSG